MLIWHDVGHKEKQHLASHLEKSLLKGNSKKELSSVTSTLTDDVSVPKRLVSDRIAHERVQSGVDDPRRYDSNDTSCHLQ